MENFSLLVLLSNDIIEMPEDNSGKVFYYPEKSNTFVSDLALSVAKEVVSAANYYKMENQYVTLITDNPLILFYINALIAIGSNDKDAIKSETFLEKYRLTHFNLIDFSEVKAMWVINSDTKAVLDVSSNGIAPTIFNEYYKKADFFTQEVKKLIN